MDKQKTIQKEFTLSGAGLHTGNKTVLTVKPAEADTGIIFLRVDLSHRPAIKVSVDSLVPAAQSPRRTSIGHDGAEVQMIEHLLAAFSGAGVDNAIIEINGNEVPGLDGSSQNITQMIHTSGIKELDAQRHPYSLREPVCVEEEGSSIVALPADELKISYTLNYSEPISRTEFMQIVVTPEVFEKQLAGARTFCLESEAEELRRQGLGLGANYENTLVLGKDGVIKNTLRYPDEFIRHKILDLIGDLYLLGYPLKAHIIATRSGHSLNIKLIKKIQQQKLKYAAAGIPAGSEALASGELDVNAIMKILPHREPFLFVDRILHLEPGKRVVGIKNVTMNDYFFRGHFPGKPVMPGVIIVEAMAQVGGVMMLSPEANRGKIAFFMAANNIKFRKTVVPGDQLVFEVDAGRVKARTGQVFGKAFVDGKLVAEAELMFAFADA